jgi:hypothetical protein
VPILPRRPLIPPEGSTSFVHIQGGGRRFPQKGQRVLFTSGEEAADSPKRVSEFCSHLDANRPAPFLHFVTSTFECFQREIESYVNSIVLKDFLQLSIPPEGSTSFVHIQGGGCRFPQKGQQVLFTSGEEAADSPRRVSEFCSHPGRGSPIPPEA